MGLVTLLGRGRDGHTDGRNPEVLHPASIDICMVVFVPLGDLSKLQLPKGHPHRSSPGGCLRDRPPGAASGSGTAEAGCWRISTSATSTSPTSGRSSGDSSSEGHAKSGGSEFGARSPAVSRVFVFLLLFFFRELRGALLGIPYLMDDVVQMACSIGLHLRLRRVTFLPTWPGER